MKTNKLFVFLLFVFLYLELLISNFILNLNRNIVQFNFEILLIFDLIFAFYIINKDLLLQEKSYLKEKYMLNFNNLFILIVLYIEGIFSPSLFSVNLLFIFAIPIFVVNHAFPSKININLTSLLITYMTVFFVIKNFVAVVLFLDVDVYFNLLYASRNFVNVIINIFLIILFTWVFKNKLQIKKRS